MRYRKKPVVVEARYWDGTKECLYDLRSWTLEWFRPVDDGIYSAEVYDELHDSWIKLSTGDFIIKGPRGEFYPCEKSVFEDTYEVA